MKPRPLSLALVLFLLSSAALASQDKPAARPPVLLVYEQSNSNIDPWVALFKEEFKARNIPVDAMAAAELKGKDLSAYGDIVVHGAVMAFGSSEPIRDWLKTKVDLSGKRVHLLATANRWSLKTYFGQLKKLLGQDKAILADAVSSATKDLGPEDKRALAKGVVDKIQ